MKKNVLLLLVAFIALVLNTKAQLVNCNPDPNGDPWYAGGNIPLTEEKWASIPKLILTPESETTPLPLVVDNAQLPYFPPIIDQISGSCAQASGIGYIFTYEINRLRNVPANTDENIYPYLYTYNFLYGEEGPFPGATFITSGWDIAKQNGIPVKSV